MLASVKKAKRRNVLMSPINLVVYGIYLLLCHEQMGPETSTLGPDISQTLNHTQQLRSIQFLASGVRPVSVPWNNMIEDIRTRKQV